MKKKIAALFLVIVLSGALCFAFTGCVDAHKSAEEHAKQIMTAIVNEDSATIKSAFSEWAIEEADNIDRQINELLNIFKNKEIAWEFETSIATHEHVMLGVTQEMNVTFKCTITSDEEEYRLWFSDWLVYKDHPEKVGLWSMCLIYRDYLGGSLEHPGITITLIRF